MLRNVRDLIDAKRKWTEPLRPDEESLGFRGWYSRGYLPHFDVPGVLQTITFRLHDAMPANRRSEWEHFLKVEDEQERQTKIEAYLDAGHGECHLKNPRIASLVQKAILHFDGQRYRAIAWVVMPNHVHALIEVWQEPLPKILQSWKSFTSKEANRLLKRTGIFWQPEYFDRYIRNEEHFSKAIHYIENNPVKAHLVQKPEDWIFSSARGKLDGSAGILPASGTEQAQKMSEDGR